MKAENSFDRETNEGLAANVFRSACCAGVTDALFLSLSASALKSIGPAGTSVTAFFGAVSLTAFLPFPSSFSAASQRCCFSFHRSLRLLSCCLLAISSSATSDRDRFRISSLSPSTTRVWLGALPLRHSSSPSNCGASPRREVEGGSLERAKEMRVRVWEVKSKRMEMTLSAAGVSHRASEVQKSESGRVGCGRSE